MLERVYAKADALRGNVDERALRRHQAARLRAASHRIERFLREQDERLERLGL